MKDELSLSLNTELNKEDQIFCSIIAATEEEKIRLFNVMNSPENRLADFVNMEIEVSDVIAETVRIIDDSGEESLCPRIILVSPDGAAYQCVSNGIYSALKKAFNIFGAPHWDKARVFKVKQIKKGNNSVLTLEMVR